MKTSSQISILVLIPFLMGSCLAGERSATATQIQPTPSPAGTPGGENIPIGAGMISQWGIDAEASSEFADPEWSASQAVGRPDAPGCGDYQFAWASGASDSVETLEVSFSRLVYPQGIIVYESFNPDQVVKIEVLNPETGAYYTVLQKNPVQIDRPCPYELNAVVEGIEFKTNRVRITVDQSQLGLGWNEIDAVELIGSIDPIEQ